VSFPPVILTSGHSPFVLLLNGDGRFLACSPGLGKLIGEGGRIRAWDEQGLELDRDQWPEVRLGRDENFDVPLLIALADGSQRLFTVHGRPLQTMASQRPGPSGGVLIFDEADAGREAETVAALISHELRTPLTVLHAALQLLDRTLPQERAEPARRYLAEALAEARQLNVLTSQLWEATRLQSGELLLRVERLSLVPLVREVSDRAQRLAGGQHIAIAAPAEPVLVDADPVRLDQILTNLLLNAIIYARGTPRIDVRVRHEGAEVGVEVQDHGSGMRGQRLARLAEAFYQPPRKDRPSRSGLGLGLYICRELARLHGGRLEMRSSEGQGSTFVLWLPAAVPAEPAPRPTGREDVKLTQRRQPVSS